MNKDRITLEQLDKKMPFKTPENYFEDFASNLEGQLNSKKSVKVAFSHRMRPYLYAAAIFIGLLVVSIPVYKKLHKPVEVVSTEELKSYVASEVDEETIVDYMEDNDIQ